ncbi:PRC-barrel domain-containing protein [Streptomyces sp. Wb2n-11]|uniref:PRC-barrel domain-containing protein n=1 Tax=Streptomyces sp. Wb2n-11 TaxID=1030533 RepID=UPI000A773D7C|nr:PRC-barrel domain-containing protein [Streptomyces sp. Wb2n-11]
MIPQEQLVSLAGQPVFAVDGRKVGDVVHVLLDDTTGRPEWVRVRGGSASGDVFVPLRGAVGGDGRLEVPFSSAVIEAASRVEVECGDGEVLSVADEEKLSACFALTDVREQVNAEGGSGWSAMDRAQDVQAGTAGQESLRTRLRVLHDSGA